MLEDLKTRWGWSNGLGGPELFSVRVRNRTHIPLQVLHSMAALMLVQVSGLSKSLPATGLVTYERALA